MSYLLGHMEAARIIGEELIARSHAIPAGTPHGAAAAVTTLAIGQAFENAAARMQQQMRDQCGKGSSDA